MKNCISQDRRIMTAIPHFEIKITKAPHEKLFNTAIPQINSNVPLDIKWRLGRLYWVGSNNPAVRIVNGLIHRAELCDTPRIFSIACSVKFEISWVKRSKKIKKMTENGATSTASCQLVFHCIKHTDRLGTLGNLKKKYQAFILIDPR